MEAVFSGFVATFLVELSCRKNNGALGKAPESAQQSWLRQSGAAVEHFPILLRDAAEQLADRNGVTLTFEAERPADDVEHHLEFRAGDPA